MGKNYSLKENVLRVMWGAIDLFFFRYSPRLFYSWRNFILKLFGAKIGKGVKIYPSAKIMYPWLLEIGDHTTISWEVKIYNLGKTRIGSNSMISQYAHLCGGTHDHTSGHFELLRTGLTIGSNVWVAADAFVGPSVVVHDGAIVAARAVVISDVKTGAIVGGNPAKEIGKIENSYNHSL